MKIIIALDGHSSCGKSTYAKRIAAELGYAYIDTGAMYRAVTLAAMDAGLFDHTDAPPLDRVEALLDDIRLDLKFNPELHRTEIYLNGRMVEDLIRRMEVAAHVSFIATIPAVRRKMVEYQRSLGKEKGIVMDGRDIGTVVFPNADLKIFMSATVQERAERRKKEQEQKGVKINLDKVVSDIEYRDQQDQSRDHGPLLKAEDAVEIDTTLLSVEQQIQKILELAKVKIEAR